MEKVKITKLQRAVINVLVANVDQDNAYHMEKFIKANGKSTDMLSHLNKFTPMEFSLLLNGWYEVVDEFKIGDWVKRIDCEKYEYVDEYFDLSLHMYEKVTEAWKKVLLDIGRENIQLEIGDIFIDNYGNFWMIDSEDYLYEYAYEYFNEDKVTKYFPHELGIDLK